MIEIYTDGGFSKVTSEGIGAYAFIIYKIDKDKKREKIISDAKWVKGSTNNKMELTAAIEAIKALENIQTDKTEIELYSDSMYLINGAKLWIDAWKKNNWKTIAGSDVKNQDLWMKIDKIKTKYPTLKWFWVKGHQNNACNIECDALVQEQIRKGKEELLNN
jgi:ribonuclease HI